MNYQNIPRSSYYRLSHTVRVLFYMYFSCCLESMTIITLTWPSPIQYPLLVTPSDHFSLQNKLTKWCPHFDEVSRLVFRSVLFSSLGIMPSTIHTQLTTNRSIGRVEVHTYSFRFWGGGSLVVDFCLLNHEGESTR